VIPEPREEDLTESENEVDIIVPSMDNDSSGEKDSESVISQEMIDSSSEISQKIPKIKEEKIFPEER
jgi:galactitol-specific phosphotransferase system IIB component